MSSARNPTDSLLAALTEATLLVDTASDLIVAANGRAVTLLKLPMGQPARLSRLIHGSLADFIVFIEEVDHRGEAWTRRVSVHDSDENPLRIELRGRPLIGEDNQVLLTLIDLETLDRHARIAETEEIHRSGLMEWKRAQSFFSELERQNQLILNAAGEGIYGVNAEGKTTFLNRAAQEMLGWTADDLLGRDIHSVIHHHHLNGEVYKAHDCPIYRSFRFDQVNRIEDEVFWRKDGRPIRVEYVSTPIYDQKVLAGAVVIFRDITERKENERQLRDAFAEIADLRDRLEEENAYLQEAISNERAHHDIIGQSPAIRRVLTQIEMVSRTGANVLISGEAGTGKALVASAIHKDSERHRRPLIHFKCGSIGPEALESELFGQVRGASPGALRDKPGALELAHGGTLFLDEVAEISLDQQGRLLEALQSGRVIRLGDSRAREVDVRVIASSSRGLEREVQIGRFRQELFFHFNVFPIHCAPLRDRPDDIPPLAVHLLKLACKRLNREVPLITEGTMRTLLKYAWPGNVRELANVIERGAIVSTAGKLQIDIHASPVASTRGSATLLSEAEIEGIRTANLIACLRETKGRVAGPDGAATILGIQPTTLYSRIKKSGLDPKEWQ